MVFRPNDAALLICADEPMKYRSEDDFLGRLGQRVRELRAQRGMSRKVVANLAGISERYIAQLESGKGNASIMLLRQVAHTLGTRPEHLISDPPDLADWAIIRELLQNATENQIADAKRLLGGGVAHQGVAFQGIALIGPRGAGKSTLGAMLAKSLDWRFTELHREVELQNGLPLPEIIALYDQEGVRRLEHISLKRILLGGGPIVLSVGDGFAADPRTFDLLLSSFFTIWLKAEPREIVRRLRKKSDTGTMGDDKAIAELHNILSTRESFCSRAAATIDTAGLPVDIIAARLREIVAPTVQNLEYTAPIATLVTLTIGYG